MWAAKIDLKHAYFHLPMAEKMKPYLRLQVGQEVFQFQSACFGLSTLPQLWMSLMRVLQKEWRKQGIICFTYLDDILIVGTSETSVARSLEFVCNSLQDAGMTINKEKSILTPSQVVKHLGFEVNFEKGVLQVPSEKLKNVRKELGKLVTKENITCRKMAAVLGSVRSFLTALPFLRAFTDQMLAFVRKNSEVGWDSPLEIPAERGIRISLHNSPGREFGEKSGPRVARRQFKFWMGRTRPDDGKIYPRILARKETFAHKRHGAQSGSGHCQEPLQERRYGTPQSRQFSGVLVSAQGRRQETAIQQGNAGVVGLAATARPLFTFFSFKSTSPSAARRKCPALTRQHAQGLLNTKHVEICRKCSQNCKEERKRVRKGQINVRRLVRELYRVFAIRMTKSRKPDSTLKNPRKG